MADELSAAAQELLKGRDSLCAYYVAQRPDYELYRHHRVILEHCEAMERGEFENLMVFMPPQNGKQCSDSTPVLTSNRGWVTHGELRIGDKVFHPDGSQIRVMDVIPQPEPCSLEVEFFDGAKVKVHPCHEWTVYDRAHRKWRTIETRDLMERQISTEPVRLKTGAIHRSWRKKPILKAVAVTSGDRARFQLPQRGALQYETQEFEMPPYVLGAWLGDGKSADGCITHAADDDEVALAVGQDFQLGAVQIHKTTGVKTSRFYGLGTGLRCLGLLNNKHIPRAYQRGSVDQRLELLAGLIDTDGCVHRPSRRVTFANTNKRLAEDVAELIRGLGWRATISATLPKLSSSGIQGRQTVYQITFSPDMKIPTRLPRKRIEGFKVMRRRIGIKAIRKVEPESGRCITVESPDGLYLVGRELIPTHNSKSITTAFPAWYWGRHPNHLLFLSAYSQELTNDFAGEIRDFIQTDYHRAIFPECSLNETANALHDFRTTAGGACRSAGRGGSITGRGAHLYVIDDPEKDKREAQSEAVQRELRQWFNTVVMTRRAPGAHVCMVKTRWDALDLAGWELAEHSGQWKVVELPALGTWHDDDTRTADELNGEPLWPERYSRAWLEDMRSRLPRDDWLALYQQRPSRDGDDRIFSEEWFQLFTPRPNNEDIRQMFLNIIVDPAKGKKKRHDYTVMWVIGNAPDRNFYFVDGIRARLGQRERWDALKALYQKWSPNCRRIAVWYEEFGLMSDIEYFNERMREEGCRFYIERIGSTRISKDDWIRDFGTGICKDRRVYFNQYIWTTTDGRKVNLTAEFLNQEWTRYPAVAHDDMLNAAAYVTDPRISQAFPNAARNASTEELYKRIRDRRKGTSYMGA